MVEQGGEVIPRIMIGHGSRSSLSGLTPEDAFGSHPRLSEVVPHAVLVEHGEQADGSEDVDQDAVLLAEDANHPNKLDQLSAHDVDNWGTNIPLYPGSRIVAKYSKESVGTIGTILRARSGRNCILTSSNFRVCFMYMLRMAFPVCTC